MIVLPADSFLMGSPPEERGRGSDEGPQRGVAVASFALGKTEVSFDEWDLCVSKGGCRHKPEAPWGRGSLPVINVSWNDAKEYVAWLSTKTRQPYRLPSEAEWEYAARAGSTTPYSWGKDIGKKNANCNGCGSRWDGKQTAPVASFPANAFGLHDMAGNVWEWVEDCWHDNYSGAPGKAWPAWQGGTCDRRVLRGGSWDDGPGDVRSAYRLRFEPGDRYSDTGFRVARTLP
jgi:formylglycine-generating enzyme required for sulfatase activity